MDNQTAFTTMVQHLRTQGAPSIGTDDDGNKGCYYRHPDGIKRCAVGVLISDEDYKDKYEGNNAFMVSNNIASLQNIDLDLLSIMQNAHDLEASAGSIKNWATRMEECYTKIAREFNLVVPTHPCATPQASDVVSESMLQVA